MAYDYEAIKVDRAELLKREAGVWRYKELLPVTNKVSLKEGATTLHHCENLAEEVGINQLYAKNEGENPTGSFKDRGMTVGVSKALELGIKTVGCASTGNTSASLAAYSAKAKLRSLVFIPEDKIAYGKLAQALVYGSEIFAVKGNFDAALEIVKKLSDDRLLYLLNSINPFRLEGQKTMGYEIMDALEDIDRIIIPVGNAGNISALWKSIKEYEYMGWLDEKPKIHGIQAENSSPIVDYFENSRSELVPIDNPETVASAIRIGNPANWEKAVKVIKESKGCMEKVSDREIVAAQSLLACKEGLFVEPASAASIAGLKKLVQNGKIKEDERIVCITTGNGLKDPDLVVNEFKDSIHHVKTDLASITKLIAN